jgi:hypothetical protein
MNHNRTQTTQFQLNVPTDSIQRIRKIVCKNIPTGPFNYYCSMTPMGMLNTKKLEG